MKSIFFLIILINFSFSYLEKATTQAKQDMLLTGMSSVIFLIKFSVHAVTHSPHVVPLNL